eukprot:TRINITY_DN52032_c0_g1_i1.p2 TRINITY_DN52032_c0_g1~~TRINITY_DN52032_c0_g1_i1.p2  ORF type:complete len:304 (+),score=108.70 TRINITY_DN52032_c0_g1_i1:68-913(+)
MAAAQGAGRPGGSVRLSLPGSAAPPDAAQPADPPELWAPLAVAPQPGAGERSSEGAGESSGSNSGVEMLDYTCPEDAIPDTHGRVAADPRGGVLAEEVARHISGITPQRLGQLVGSASASQAARVPLAHVAAALGSMSPEQLRQGMAALAQAPQMVQMLSSVRGRSVKRLCPGITAEMRAAAAEVIGWQRRQQVSELFHSCLSEEQHQVLHAHCLEAAMAGEPTGVPPHWVRSELPPTVAAGDRWIAELRAMRVDLCEEIELPPIQSEGRQSPSDADGAAD